MDEFDKITEEFKSEIKEIGLLSNVFEKYPKQFGTSVYKIFDDEGIEPSGGEAQQIAIARSLYKSSKINILDEPTAALDPQIEFDLYQKYDVVTKGNLSFFVSHRMGSCKFASRIIVFENGKVIEDVSHTKLINRGGKYSELFNNQASLYNSLE
jgi:ATP-binding cassette subfamily B protein